MDLLQEEDYELQVYGTSSRLLVNTLLTSHNDGLEKFFKEITKLEFKKAKYVESKINIIKENYKQTILEVFKEFKEPTEKLFQIPKNVVLDVDEPKMIFENKVDELKAEVIELEDKIIQTKASEKILERDCEFLRILEDFNTKVREISDLDIKAALERQEQFKNLFKLYGMDPDVVQR